MPVLNVSSRVFWLELDDKALLDSYSVLQEGILSDVFSQKCSAAWQSARGERPTVGIMLPGRQDADDWLNFMLTKCGAQLQTGFHVALTACFSSVCCSPLMLRRTPRGLSDVFFWFAQVEAHMSFILGTRTRNY